MTTVPYPRHIVDRFWSRVARCAHGDCWEWRGARSDNGYGHLSTGERTVSAHRFSYELTHGSIPSGYHVCHTCDKRLCVNPAHLFAGSRQENMDDMLAKERQTHGDRHPNAIYSDELIAELRRRWDAGGISKRRLAREFGISYSHTCSILNRVRRRIQ